jgi:hypothetical protein
LPRAKPVSCRHQAFDAMHAQDSDWIERRRGMIENEGRAETIVRFRI